jgi:bacteriocin-like protein
MRRETAIPAAAFASRTKGVPMSDDRKNDKELKELKDEELDNVSGGSKGEFAGAGGSAKPDYLSVKKLPIPKP